MVVDEPLARELELFYENDEPIYRQSVLAWYRNFRRKQKRGVYNHVLAVKGIAENFVPMIATQYRRQVVPLPPIDRETKYFIAERFVREFEVEYGDGSSDSSLGV